MRLHFIFLLALASLYASPIIINPSNPNFINGGLLFNEVIGGGGITPNQLVQNLTIAVSSGSSTFTATATDLNCTNCVTVPPGPYTATNPGMAATIPVSVNITGLTPNSYFGIITLSSQSPDTGTTTIPVTLVVAAQPAIGLPIPKINLSHAINVTNAATNTVAEPVTAANTLNEPYPFTATVNAGAPWLLINGSNTTPASGNTPGGLTIGYNPAGLTSGRYSGQITISIPNAAPSTQTLDVTLTVDGPMLQAQGTTLLGTTGGAPVSATINVMSNSSASGDEISYTISSMSIPAGWLTATAVGGNTTTPGAVAIMANPGTLAAGTYSGTVSLAPTNAALSPLTLDVSFIVSQPTVKVALPDGAPAATFTAVMNNPVSFSPPVSLNLANSVTPSSSVQFTAAISPTGNWLTLNGGTGAVMGVTPATLTLGLSPFAATLPSGRYDALLTINFTGASNSAATIPVTLTVATSVPCSFTFSGTGTLLPYTGTATPSSMPPGAVYPSIPVSIAATPNPNCPAGTTFTVTANHPEWLTATQTPTGFTFNALSNPHSTGRSAVVTVTPTNTGTSPGVPATFIITEPASPLPRAEREVIALYEQLLGREPDQAGFNFWTGQGAAGLGQMADSFLTSPEAQTTDFQVLTAYQGALGRFPSFAEYSQSLARLRSGSTPSDLFTQLLGTGTNSPVITTVIYLNLLGRAPTASELNAAQAMPPFQLYTTLAASPEFKNQTVPQTPDHSNFLYIKMLYFVILQRDSDPAGFNFWLNAANGAGPGIFFNSPATRITILGDGQPGVGFLGSNEFQSLFQ